MTFDHEANNKSNKKERWYSLHYCFNSHISLYKNTYLKLVEIALTPYIKFLKPQSNLCAICEELHYKIAHINDPQKKENVIKEYNDHLQAVRLE
ncbi:5666_t:CDS:2 [Cetraspora pellucida]|uniref:5666_t:CDS:1 n=1 Tax=Cetraspora pellucida TaxID=1433469 RepID=A0A9N9FP87_9GLOM|nr:5666_t:CDS:2 [Cetraspora pellucida]